MQGRLENLLEEGAYVQRGERSAQGATLRSGL